MKILEKKIKIDIPLIIIGIGFLLIPTITPEDILPITIAMLYPKLYFYLFLPIGLLCLILGIILKLKSKI